MDLKTFEQIALIGVVIQIIMQGLGRITDQVFPWVLTRTWYKALVVGPSNLYWGLIFAISPSLGLPGATYGQRAMMGLIAGAFSHVSYEVFLKRWSPTALPKPPELGDGPAT